MTRTNSHNNVSPSYYSNNNKTGVEQKPKLSISDRIRIFFAQLSHKPSKTKSISNKNVSVVKRESVVHPNPLEDEVLSVEELLNNVDTFINNHEANSQSEEPNTVFEQAKEINCVKYKNSNELKKDWKQRINAVQKTVMDRAPVQNKKGILTKIEKAIFRKIENSTIKTNDKIQELKRISDELTSANISSAKKTIQASKSWLSEQDLFQDDINQVNETIASLDKEVKNAGLKSLVDKKIQLLTMRNTILLNSTFPEEMIVGTSKLINETKNWMSREEGLSETDKQKFNDAITKLQTTVNNINKEIEKDQESASEVRKQEIREMKINEKIVSLEKINQKKKEETDKEIERWEKETLPKLLKAQKELAKARSRT